MQKPIYFLLLFIIASPIIAQSPAPGWLKHYPGEEIYSVQAGTDGFLFLARQNQLAVAGTTDTDGALQQTVFLDTLFSDGDIISVENGAFLQANLQNHSSLFGATAQVKVKKFDANGQMLWSHVLSDSIRLTEVVLTLLADGNYGLAGVERLTNPCGAPSPAERLRLLKINPAGDMIWTNVGITWCSSIAGQIPFNRLWELLPLPDGGFISIINAPESLISSFYVQKYNASGTMLWQSLMQITGEGSVRLAPLSINLTNAGNIRILLTHVSASVGGGHGGSNIVNEIRTLAASTGHLLHTTVFPVPSTSQFVVKYAPLAYAAASLNQDEMAMVLTQNKSHRMIRLGFDLQDTVWEHPLPDATAAFWSPPVSRPARILKALSACGELLLGGQDSLGIYLAKTDCAGNSAPAFPVAGHLWEDTDFDCATSGPLAPLPGAQLHLASTTDTTNYYVLTADSSGYSSARVTAGDWRLFSTDKLLPISGFSCQPDTILSVDSLHAAAQFNFRVVRYKALLKGLVWFDYNNNCQADEIQYNSQLTRVAIVHNDDTLYFQAALGLPFQIRVDTGYHQLWLSDYPAGPFSGYNCPFTNAVEFHTFDQTDSVVLMYGAARGYIQPRAYWDINFNCQMDTSDYYALYFQYKVTDTLTGQFRLLDYNNSYVYVAPGGVYKVELLSNIPDSLVCQPTLPILLPFQLGDTLDASPLFSVRPYVITDYPVVCSGALIDQQYVYNDTFFTQINYVDGDDSLTLVNHQVTVLEAPVIHIYQVDTSLVAGSTQIFIYTAANGCDSTVILHLLTTTGVQEINGRSALSVHPNPAVERVIVEIPTADFERLLIRDVSGNIWREILLQPGQQLVPIEIGALLPGVYRIQGNRRNGQITWGHLVITAE